MVIFRDASNRIYLRDITSQPNDLQPNSGAFHDNFVCAVGVLWRCRVTVPFDVGRDKLHSLASTDLKAF